ncbi:MAG: hypothetical protein ACYCSN_09515 [Acidobacteriaceae bacterium]
MKNIVRVFALSLVAIGAIASVHTSNAAQTQNVSMMTSSSPAPCLNCSF